MILYILKGEDRHLKLQLCVLLYFIIFLCPLLKRIEFYPPEREREPNYLQPIYWNMLDNIAHPPLLVSTLELVKYFLW